MRFSKDHLPTEAFSVYRKKTVTQAIFIPHPFEVESREGPLEITDPRGAYLAIDNEGYPYPIDIGIFESAYEEVEH